MIITTFLTVIFGAEDNFSWKSTPGVLPPIRNQLSPHFCGSCWAVQVADMLSARLVISNKTKGIPVWLSPNQLLCDQKNIGCLGGDTYRALKFVEKRGLSELSEGYQARSWLNGKDCSPAPKGRRVFAQKVRLVKSVEMMQQQIYQKGPIVCGVASDPLLDNYTSGVITKSTNGNTVVSHDVLLTGWGLQDGVPFWEVRNSFGPVWGDKGGFKIQRGLNLLGIQSYCSTADVDWKPLPFDYNLTLSYLDKVAGSRAQAGCESGWGFAAVQMLSDRYKISFNRTVQISVQQLLNCGIGNCKNGDAFSVLTFAKNYGLVPESCVGYQASQPLKSNCDGLNNCKSCSRPLTNSSWDDSPQNCVAINTTRLYVSDYGWLYSADQIKKQLKFGPVVCPIHVTQAFLDYQGGLFVQKIPKSKSNHYVQVIGWGSESGKQFWLVKNSYGRRWGENGLGRLAIGLTGLLESQCIWGNLR